MKNILVSLLCVLTVSAAAQIQERPKTNAAVHVKCGANLEQLYKESNEKHGEYLFMTLDIDIGLIERPQVFKQIWMYNPEKKTATIIYARTDNNRDACFTTGSNVTFGTALAPEKRIIYPQPVVKVKQ